MLELIVTGDDPRILDIDLAEALGLKAVRNIRTDLILPNRDELETHGILQETAANTGKRGRPARVFHLNEQQALLVCMFSRTEKAAQVRKEVIDVFMAYRRGHLELSATGKVALPDFENPAEAARAFADLWEQGARDRALRETHLEWVTVQAFTALNKMYLSRFQKQDLGIKAAELCEARGIEVQRERRDWKQNGPKTVGRYPIHILAEAAKLRGIDAHNILELEKT